MRITVLRYHTNMLLVKYIATILSSPAIQYIYNTLMYMHCDQEFIILAWDIHYIINSDIVKAIDVIVETSDGLIPDFILNCIHMTGNFDERKYSILNINKHALQKVSVIKIHGMYSFYMFDSHVSNACIV